MLATICEVPCFLNGLPGKEVRTEVLQAPFKIARAFDAGYVRGVRVCLVNGDRFDVYLNEDPGTSNLVRCAVAYLQMKGIGNGEAPRHEGRGQLDAKELSAHPRLQHSAL